MGNRRLGRKRLYALNKQGQTNTLTGGKGMQDAVVSNTVRREGHKIITEIAVDLGTSKNTISSQTTVNDIIGVSSSAGERGAAATDDDQILPHLPSYLTQLTAETNGYMTYAEMTCTETPVGGVTDIDMYIGPHATGAYDMPVDDGAAMITRGDVWAIGEVDHYAVGHGTAHDIGAEDAYVYLSSGTGGSQGDYSAGKFVITIEGYAVPDSI